MNQTDENKDIENKAAEARRTVEAVDAPEDGNNTAVKRKLISTATLKVISEEGKKLSEKILKNPHASELIKLQGHNLAMAALAAAEVIPETALTGDLVKILALAHKAAKKGKENGFFDNLYKGVPKAINGFPVIPELYKSTVNQFKSYKEAFLFGKDMITSYANTIKNIAHPPASVQQARLQFTPKMA